MNNTHPTLLTFSTLRVTSVKQDGKTRQHSSEVDISCSGVGEAGVITIVY